MSSRAGFWATFLALVAAAVVAFAISGMRLTDLTHLGTPRNALLDGGREVRIPVPPPSDGRVLPEVYPTTTGSYGFMFEDQGEPVRFDPCRSIHYVYNADGEVPGARDLIDSAVEAVSAATGLDFVYDGPSDEVASFDRRLFQEDTVRGGICARHHRMVGRP